MAATFCSQEQHRYPATKPKGPRLLPTCINLHNRQREKKRKNTTKQTKGDVVPHISTKISSRVNFFMSEKHIGMGSFNEIAIQHKSAHKKLLHSAHKWKNVFLVVFSVNDLNDHSTVISCIVGWGSRWGLLKVSVLDNSFY